MFAAACQRGSLEGIVSKGRQTADKGGICMQIIIVLIFGAFILVAAVGILYLFTRFRKMLPKTWWEKQKKGPGEGQPGQGSMTGRKRASLMALIPILGLVLYCVLDFVNGVIVIVNAFAIWLAVDLIGLVIRKITKKTPGYYWCGVAALVVTAVYLGSGWYFAHHVYETDYIVRATKDIGMERLRIVQISDSHVGTTFDGDGFAKHMERVQETNPDIVVVTGDYVDDDTTKAEMVRSCEALGNLETTYGVFYVYGNHDKGYMETGDFDDADLRAEMAKNNVTILEDDYAMIGEDIYLIGRQDRSEEMRQGRMDMDTLTKDINKDKYMILLDHQPNDFDEEESAGVDLVLCGHTHGGQMFPVGITGVLSGANDMNYGMEVRGNTTFIVNSGIADWAIRYKTAAIAEFGVIDLQ